MHEDHGLDRSAGGPGGRLPFLLWLWLSLATAVVCAVVPAGLPATRATGSAFDPSTTIVALRSRPPAAVKATVPRVGEGDGAGIPGDPAVPIAAASDPIVADSARLPVAGLPVPLFVLAPRAVPIALQARPPPGA